MHGSTGYIHPPVAQFEKPRPSKDLLAKMAAIIYTRGDETVKSSIAAALDILKEVDCL